MWLEVKVRWRRDVFLLFLTERQPENSFSSYVHIVLEIIRATDFYNRHNTVNFHITTTYLNV